MTFYNFFDINGIMYRLIALSILQSKNPYHTWYSTCFKPPSIRQSISSRNTIKNTNKKSNLGSKTKKNKTKFKILLYRHKSQLVCWRVQWFQLGNLDLWIFEEWFHMFLEWMLLLIYDLSLIKKWRTTIWTFLLP